MILSPKQRAVNGVKMKLVGTGLLNRYIKVYVYQRPFLLVKIVCVFDGVCSSVVIKSSKS